jgi:hypothetical protein
MKRIKSSAGDLGPVEVATQIFFRVATEDGSRSTKNIRSKTKHGRDRNYTTGSKFLGHDRNSGRDPIEKFMLLSSNCISW